MLLEGDRDGCIVCPDRLVGSPAGGAKGMDATDWIAIYAAVVSTVGVGWQIRKEWRAQRPQVEVRTYIGMLAFPTGMRPALQI